MAQQLAQQLRQLNEALKSINEDAKKLRNSKKQIEAEILALMKSTGTMMIDAGEGYSVQFVKTSKAQTLNEEFLDSVCRKYLGAEKGEQLVNSIYDEKANAVGIVEKVKLNTPRKPRK